MGSFNAQHYDEKVRRNIWGVVRTIVGEPQCGGRVKILEFIPSQKGCYFTTVSDGANLAKYPLECKNELLTKQT